MLPNAILRSFIIGEIAQQAATQVRCCIAPVELPDARDAIAATGQNVAVIQRE